MDFQYYQKEGWKSSGFLDNLCQEHAVMLEMLFNQVIVDKMVVGETNNMIFPILRKILVILIESGNISYVSKINVNEIMSDIPKMCELVIQISNFLPNVLDKLETQLANLYCDSYIVKITKNSQKNSD